MDNNTQTINVEVRRRVFEKPSGTNKWWVILSTTMGQCKGVVTWLPTETERMELTGTWKSFNGVKEFSFTLARPVIPVDSRQLLAYVCAKAIGFGAALEERIWKKYGETWKDIKAFEVQGVTDVKMREFNLVVESIALNQVQAQTVAWLMSKNVSQNMADKAWDMWGARTMPVTSADPYTMMQLPRVGFLAVDKLRYDFGVSDDDPRRIRAAITHSMSGLMQGSTVCDYRSLTTAINNETLREVSIEKITQILGAMLRDGSLVGFEEDGTMATKRDYENEKTIWEFCK